MDIMLGFIKHVKENIVQASFANLCPGVWAAAKAEQSKQPATGWRTGGEASLSTRQVFITQI